jgi:TonB family protein
MALPVHFLTLAFSFLTMGRARSVKNRLMFAWMGLALLLCGAAVQPHKAHAQDANSDSAKRKVRTRVTPEYPDLAKRMNVTGKVKIEATVSADGRVVSTRVVGGSPLLVNAAIDALKQWRFEPGPKDTTEIIEFAFN